MRSQVLAAFAAVLLASPLVAAENEAELDFGKDRFLAGETVTLDKAGVDDLFMAGETVRGESDISGSAHMAGRKVEMVGSVGGDAYLAGVDVRLKGKVSGDATLAGYDVSVGEVDGDLRISGSELKIDGPISGYALIAGEEVRIEGVIAGDTLLNSRDVEFGDDARIEGQLILFEREGEKLEIPERVVPEDRIERRDFTEWEDSASGIGPVSWRRIIGKFFIGVLIVAALAALIAAVIPKTLAELRSSLLERPFRNLGYGFVAESAAIGSAVVFAMTLIGIALLPASLLVALVLGFAGYVVAVYAFGVGLLLAFGGSIPESIGWRVLAAAIGAVVVGVIALIPFAGWLFVLALVLAGVGAITLRVFQPKSFAEA